MPSNCPNMTLRQVCAVCLRNQSATTHTMVGCICCATYVHHDCVDMPMRYWLHAVARSARTSRREGGELLDSERLALQVIAQRSIAPRIQPDNEVDDDFVCEACAQHPAQRPCNNQLGSTCRLCSVKSKYMMMAPAADGVLDHKCCLEFVRAGVPGSAETRCRGCRSSHGLVVTCQHESCPERASFHPLCAAKAAPSQHAENGCARTAIGRCIGDIIASLGVTHKATVSVGSDAKEHSIHPNPATDDDTEHEPESSSLAHPHGMTIAVPAACLEESLSDMGFSQMIQSTYSAPMINEDPLFTAAIATPGHSQLHISMAAETTPSWFGEHLAMSPQEQLTTRPSLGKRTRCTSVDEPTWPIIAATNTDEPKEQSSRKRQHLASSLSTNPNIHFSHEEAKYDDNEDRISTCCSQAVAACMKEKDKDFSLQLQLLRQSHAERIRSMQRSLDAALQALQSLRREC